MKKYCHGPGRRDFLIRTGTLTAFYLAPTGWVKTFAIEKTIPLPVPKEKIKLVVNGVEQYAEVDSRMTLLDFLREQLGLTGTKKGCAMGQCGACIVHIDGRRMNSCLSLATYNNGKTITTIEGLAKGEELHPMQQAFVAKDAMQCGYCTPGQIMSGIACIKEKKAGSREEIQRFMAGNICRCGAYQNIVDAIEWVQTSGEAV